MRLRLNKEVAKRPNLKTTINSPNNEPRAMSDKTACRDYLDLTPIADLGIILGEIGNCFSDSFSDSYEMTTIDSFRDVITR
jgi:hypothetical protein